MRYSFQALRRLPKVLSVTDKVLLIGLIVVIFGTSGLWWRAITSAWAVTPVKGGVYTEGIVNQNLYELDLIINKLTKIGLTYIDHDNVIHGALAERWEISEDGKTYTFFIRPGFKAEEIANTYASLPGWETVNVTAGDNNTVVMSLKQPFAPLLAFASDPVINKGPYFKEKQTKSEITFTANQRFALGEPHIQRIGLTLYPDSRSMKAALQRQEIMGADQAFTQIPGTSIKTLKLTRRTVLMFNLERDLFKDKVLRERIKDKKKLDKPIAATLVTTQEPALLEKANQFRDQANKLGLKVSIKSVNPIVLERDIVPSDDYDLLLVDLNYGYDEDPYPYWHSSQVIPPGKNYAGYNSKEADALIESARQTLDQTERRNKYAEFQKILDADVPAIFYDHDEFSYTISKRLKGVGDGIAAVPSDRYTEVWRWFIKAKKQPNN